jgi:hypothetical protein
MVLYYSSFCHAAASTRAYKIGGHLDVSQYHWTEDYGILIDAWCLPGKYEKGESIEVPRPN